MLARAELWPLPARQAAVNMSRAADNIRATFARGCLAAGRFGASAALRVAKFLVREIVYVWASCRVGQQEFCEEIKWPKRQAAVCVR